MIQREITKKLLEISNYYQIITVTGPRQSGKTTLIKDVFKELPYVLLETPDIRQRAQEDPKSFLSNYSKGAIFDEIQNVPELFSYLQGIIDENSAIKFVLSGSQNFLLLEKVNQTLAGRTGILKLLPFSTDELKDSNHWNENPLEFVFKGMYPRIYDRGIPPELFYSDYIQTYVERDVRSIKNIGNLSNFSRFLSLCAGRIGQLLNIDSLASDVGIASNTAKEWLSILEASYIIYTLKPHHKNFNKRLVKRPKLYFYDTGLACNLLQINSVNELDMHFAKGNLFENFIENEAEEHDDNEIIPYSLQLKECVNAYKKIYPVLDDDIAVWGMIENMNVQKYKPNEGYLKWHTENSNLISSHRMLVFMTYLTDVKKGGETEWFHQKLKIKPEKGLTVLWPSDWTHLHRGCPALEEEKYIITGWYSYTR